MNPGPTVCLSIKPLKVFLGKWTPSQTQIGARQSSQVDLCLVRVYETRHFRPDTRETRSKYAVPIQHMGHFVDPRRCFVTSNGQMFPELAIDYWMCDHIAHQKLISPQ